MTFLDIVATIVPAVGVTYAEAFGSSVTTKGASVGFALLAVIGSSVAHACSGECSAKMDGWKWATSNC